MTGRRFFGLLAASALAVGVMSASGWPAGSGLRAASAAPAGQAACVPQVTWDRAAACAGATTWVAGTVVEVTHARWEAGWPTILSFGRASPDPGRFEATIPGEDRWKWSPPPEEQYRGQRVCVHGEIRLAGGVVPEIIVRDPEQIKTCE